MGLSSFASSASRAALVVKEIKISEEGPLYVHIVARRAGIIAFFLTSFGIDTQSTFDVYADRLEFKHGSLSGYIMETMPLSSLSVVTGGFIKPFIELLIGLFLLFVLAIPTFGISVLFGISLIIHYLLSKTLMIHVAASSGWNGIICLKRSVIEGVEISQETADAIINIVTQLTLAQTVRD